MVFFNDADAIDAAVTTHVSAPGGPGRRRPFYLLPARAKIVAKVGLFLVVVVVVVDVVAVWAFGISRTLRPFCLVWGF